MTSWQWVREDVVLAIHDEQIAEHGGIVGVRDAGLLQSALARPENLAAYGEPTAAELAASYCFGIARNHPFLDGNKRTAFVVMELFLALNGMALEADDGNCLAIMLDVAAGDLDEATLAAWIEAHSRPR